MKHFLYVDDINNLADKQTIRIYNLEIEMEFVVKKYNHA